MTNRLSGLRQSRSENLDRRRRALRLRGLSLTKRLFRLRPSGCGLPGLGGVEVGEEGDEGRGQGLFDGETLLQIRADIARKVLFVS